MSSVQSVQSVQIDNLFEQSSNPAYLEAISPEGIKMRAFMLGAVASLVTMHVGNRVNPLLRKRQIAEFVPADFQSLLGERFHMQSGKGLLSVACLEAVHVQENDAETIFTVIFGKPQGADIVDGDYTFAHTQLGLFDLPVVVQSAGDGKIALVAKVSYYL